MKQEEIDKIEAELKEQGIKHNIVTAYLDEDDETKTATFFLRKPDKTVRSLIAKVLEKDGLEAVYAAMKNLYIKGDPIEILQKNDYALASCDTAVAAFIKVKQAELKKN